jgi:Zn finger protein HypA/HybF involved in hydrogenase expression
MHERHIVQDLIRQAESICAARAQNASRVTLTVGALSGFDPGYVDQYFRLLVEPDSPLANADLNVGVSELDDVERATAVSLDSMIFEGP